MLDLKTLAPGEVSAALRNDLALFTNVAFNVLKPNEPLLWAP